jgi:SAM-dependent methyltransferase
MRTMTAHYKKEWFDDESFWQDMYPFMFPERRFINTPEQIDKVLTLTNPSGTAALDLCCGPGRCSIALAQRGYSVTGVDTTKYLLDKARAKARTAKVKIKWVQKDMRDFIRKDSFDLVLSMFTSFGYFDDKQEDIQVLDNILASLKPGGFFLIDVMGKERLANILQPTISEVLPDGTKLIQRHEIFDNWSRIRNEWILIRKGKAKSFTFHHTIYSGQELKDRMQQVGFSDVTLYGNLDGDEYGTEAQRLIAVGRKADSCN